MTWLGKLNYLVLQWFWVRLAKAYDDGEDVGWKLLIGVVPMTGWGGGYIPKSPKSLWLRRAP